MEHKVERVQVAAVVAVVAQGDQLPVVHAHLGGKVLLRGGRRPEKLEQREDKAVDILRGGRGVSAERNAAVVANGVPRRQRDFRRVFEVERVFLPGDRDALRLAFVVGDDRAEKRRGAEADRQDDPAEQKREEDRAEKLHDAGFLSAISV